MAVALPWVVMRLSELVIIYLATAAPFGVAFFVRRQERREARALALARAACVALVWPAAVVRFLVARRGAGGEAAAEEAAARTSRRVERAQRETINALRDAEEAMLRAGLLGDEVARHIFFAARECIERFTGLTLACAEARADDGPTAREVELCRLAGRRGEDLLVAGRCLHRRNVTRLAAHRERARAELGQALAAVGALADEATEEVAAGVDCAALRAVSRALLQSYARAVELLSLLEDRAATLAAAARLDAECARLRRLEAGAAAPAPEGGEPCTTPAAHRAFATHTAQTTTSTHA